MTVDWSLVEHFRPEEFSEPDRLDPALIYLLDRVRDLAGRPIYITSDVRQEENGEHAKGLAVDVADNLQGEPLGSRWRFHVLRAAFDAGFRRIGVYDRHLHLGESGDRDRDVCWIGESQ